MKAPASPMGQAGATQTFFLGSAQPRIDAALQRYASQRLLERLWAKDASLWALTPSEQDAVRQRLGWLTIAQVMEPHVEALDAFVADIRQARFSHAILVGMGGSSLFADVCRTIFGTARGYLELSVLDTTDPATIASIEKRVPLERTLFLVSSKSGTTPEVQALSAYFYERVRASKGSRAGEQFIAITDAGTPLETHARERGFRRIFAHDARTGNDVGGRFSALTFFGLVPAALIGIDLRTLLARAMEMMDACSATVRLEDNPAAFLGVILGELACATRRQLTFACAPAFSSFGIWLEQLLAESTGKAGKGIIPIDGEPIREPSAYRASHRVFLEIQDERHPDLTLERACQALAHAGHPVIKVRWRDPYDLGGEVWRWSLATTIAGGLLGVNPFDEPNVQASKDRTSALLAEYGRSGVLSLESPLMRDGDLAVYANRAVGVASSPVQLLRGLFHQVDQAGYLALLAFLPRSPSVQIALQGLRNRLGESLGVATTVGFGPRYLHSIGQLYKGGPPIGAFLELTSEDGEELPVPGERYSFRVLQQAQALGDFQALTELGRPVILIHLGRNSEWGLGRLGELVNEALAVFTNR